MVGIIGGGLSGLFVLHGLRSRGVDAVLLEADERLGGVVRTAHLPEGEAELGPARLRLTPGLAEILDDTGLTNEIRQAPTGARFHMYREGQLHPVPLSASEALRTPLISWWGKARTLWDLLSAPPRPDETVEAAVARKLGPEVYSTLVGPLLGGLYASDPARMYARHTVLPMLEGLGGGRSLLLGLARARRMGGTPVVSFGGGMEELPRALGALHRDRIRTRCPVLDLESRDGGGFLVRTGEEEVPVRELVVTVPADPAARLLKPVAPEAGRRIRELRYNPLAVIPMEGVLPTGGTGFKVSMDEPLALRGVTSRMGLGGERPILTAYLGGMGRETLLAQPDDRLADLAAREYEAVTGEAARPLMVHRTRVPAWDTSWRHLDDLRLPKGIRICAAWHRRPGVIGRLEEARSVVARMVAEANGATIS